MSAVMDHIATVEAEPSELPQSDAVLLILKAIQHEERPAERRLLEGLACLGWKTGVEATQCRVLKSFATEAWRRRLHGSLAHLVQTGRIRRRPGGYVLTDLGRATIDELPPPDDADAEHDRINSAAQYVRDLLGLN